MGNSSSATPEEMQATQKYVEEQIASKKVVVFSKSYCPYCNMAKQALNEEIKKGNLNKEDLLIIEIENNPNCNTIQEVLQKMTGARSVPRVFINGKFFGDGSATAAAGRSGDLTKALAK